MQNLPGTVYGQADPFTATHWSVIVAAGKTQTDPEIASAALAQLCQTYWPPLYTYVRSRGYSVHDAQDLTQGFFAHLLEHKIHLRADRQLGKFRSFLLASLKNFLSHAREREQALKRGGGREFLPLDEGRAEEAESLFQTHSSSGSNALGEDRLFERIWAETLAATALDRLAAAYKAEGKEDLFDRLQTFLAVGRRSVAELFRVGCPTGGGGINHPQSCHAFAGALSRNASGGSATDSGHGIGSG